MSVIVTLPNGEQRSHERGTDAHVKEGHLIVTAAYSRDTESCPVVSIYAAERWRSVVVETDTPD